jgi:hypothetical protein
VLPINLAYRVAYQFGVFKVVLPINLAYRVAYQFGVFLCYQFRVLRFSTP